MDRAYSVLQLKAASEDRREVLGLATTPSTDRVGDIVEPSGAQFTLPIPLLWQHDQRQPIGWVREAQVTTSGIKIRAEIAKIAEPGKLKDRLDDCWGQIKAGLVRGLSIGFAPLKAEPLSSGGMRYRAWSWFELSACTIPANADCSINAVKAAFAAATPRSTSRVVVKLDDSKANCVFLDKPAARHGVVYLGEPRRSSTGRRKGVVYLR